MKRPHRSARRPLAPARAIPALASLIALTGLGLGCAIRPDFATGYEVDPHRLRPSPVAGSLAVVPFEEARGPQHYEATGREFLTYIPFIPYVTMRFERLEESVRTQSHDIKRSTHISAEDKRTLVAPGFETYYYPNSFAEAVAADLAAAGIFEKVEVVPPEEAATDRYLLRGRLIGTPLRITGSSYGLGPVGVLLWLLPIPIGKTTSQVVLDLELVDNASGHVVWQKHIESELHRYFLLYNPQLVYGTHGAFSFQVVPPPSDSKVDRHSLFSWHFEALRRGMLEARQEIANAVAGAASP